MSDLRAVGGGTLQSRVLVPASGRVDHLYVVRKSGGTVSELNKLLQQTLSAHVGSPGVRALRRMGITPLSMWREHSAVAFASGVDRACLVPAPGTGGRVMLLMAITTAAGVNENNGSFWGDLFPQTLTLLKPVMAITPSATRLNRSFTQSGTILRSLEVHCDSVMIGLTVYAMAEAESVAALHDMFGFAAKERNELVGRNGNGYIGKARNGGWVPSYREVPLGWRLENRRLVLDADAAAVRELVCRYMGDAGLGAGEIVRALGRVGLRTPFQSGTRVWTWDQEAVVAELRRLGEDEDAGGARP